jgi:glycosyltransferase involved in cell wall biosynthesis
MKLSVVVPVYNERETIEKVYERIKAVDLDKEILLVDDCSTDGTREIVRGLADDQTKVFFHEKKYGEGRRAQDGLQ